MTIEVSPTDYPPRSGAHVQTVGAIPEHSPSRTFSHLLQLVGFGTVLSSRKQHPSGARPLVAVA